MKLIVGLGNPGAQYTYTRHNLGFLVCASLADSHKFAFRKSTVINGWVVEVNIEGQPCTVLMPATFMNNSGVAVSKIAVKKGIAPADILVICDDLSLIFGSMRLRPSGMAGGHNGLKSIIEHLGSNAFARLRLGVSRPKPGIDTADYVLANFTAGEKEALPDFINKALGCCHSWVVNGVEDAMNQFNQRKSNE